MNPTHDVFVVGLFSHALKVCSKVASDFTVRLTNRMTRKTPFCFEEFLPMPRIAACLIRDLPIEAFLPEIRSNCLDLIFPVLVDSETPERRHFCSRSESLRIL